MKLFTYICVFYIGFRHNSSPQNCCWCAPLSWHQVEPWLLLLSLALCEFLLLQWIHSILRSSSELVVMCQSAVSAWDAGFVMLMWKTFWAMCRREQSEPLCLEQCLSLCVCVRSVPGVRADGLWCVWRRLAAGPDGRHSPTREVGAAGSSSALRQCAGVIQGVCNICVHVYL